MKEKIAEINTKLAKATVEADSFEKGNKSAGVRLRNLMQDIKTLATEVRGIVLTIAKGGK